MFWWSWQFSHVWFKIQYKYFLLVEFLASCSASSVPMHLFLLVCLHYWRITSLVIYCLSQCDCVILLISLCICSLYAQSTDKVVKKFIKENCIVRETLCWWTWRIRGLEEDTSFVNKYSVTRFGEFYFSHNKHLATSYTFIHAISYNFEHKVC